jgi:NADPH-dependent curcumin reductase CurA
MTEHQLNRRFLLRERPNGAFDPAVLQFVEEPAPTPAPGQALVRILYLSLDPSNLIWMGERESYMPPVALGEVMRGVAIGEVLASKVRAYPVGALVLGLLGWQDYALIAPNDAFAAMRLPRLPFVQKTSLLGALGITGLTAYFGITDIAKPRRGETMVVTAAAGAVGSIAGQIARLRGARVVGVAGSHEKCRWLVQELGFAAAICRRDPDWRAQLKAACPHGVDISFENVGGEIMEAVFELLNPHARVALCGLIAEYAQGGSAPGPRNFSNFLMRRVHLQGFNVLDARRRFVGATLRLALWLALGRIKDRHTLITGLSNAPAALKGLFDGDNIGKLIVQVAE